MFIKRLNLKIYLMSKTPISAKQKQLLGQKMLFADSQNNLSITRFNHFARGSGTLYFTGGISSVQVFFK